MTRISRIVVTLLTVLSLLVAIPAQAAFTKSYTAVGGGTEKYVYNTSIALAAGDMTVEGYFNPASLPGSGALSWLWFFNVDASHRSFYTFLGNTSGQYYIFLQLYGGAAPTAQINIATPTVGTWVHYAVTWNNTTGTYTAYVNGVSQGTASMAAGSQAGATTEFDIAGRNIANVDTNGFSANVSNVKFWSMERSAAQVAADMCSTYGATTNLLGEWSLDNVLTDNSGNGKTLTNNNAGVFVTDAPNCSPPAAPAGNGWVTFFGDWF